MSITTRILLFVLVTLAAVLLSFSAALYALADRYLHGYAADRVSSAMETLCGAVETSYKGLEWEPHKRVLRFHQGPFSDDIQWRVVDDGGRVIDRSEVDRLLVTESASSTEIPSPARSPRRAAEPCLIVRKTILASPSAVKTPRAPRVSALKLSAGMSLSPIEATLNWIRLALFAVSATIWVTVLLLGRYLCRSALAPLSRMAVSTRRMSAATLDVRLPNLDTADELAEMCQAFNGLLDRLQEAFERQRRFTAEASHQLRTPLTAILGQVEVALRRERPDEEYRRVLAIVHRQGTNLRELVESLLYLARADAEGRLPDCEPLDASDWAPRLLAEWNSHPRWLDVHWTLTTKSPCWISANSQLLAEVVKNLLDNAFTYSEPGQPIEIELQTDKNEASLSVQDRGQGISSEDQLHLFDPFFRSAESRRKGLSGVGLGLAVVSRLVKEMGGRVEVTSQLGAGSRFTIVFPTLEATGAERNSPLRVDPPVGVVSDPGCSAVAGRHNVGVI